MDWNGSAGGRNVAYGTLGLMVIFSIYACWPDSAPEGGTSANAALASDATSNPEPADQSENRGVIEQPSPETVVQADEQVEEATIVEESTTTDQTAGWKTLTHVYGWSIQYPETWESSGHHGTAPEDDIGPVLTGPKGCYDNNLRCGSIQIDLAAFHSEFSLTPRQYLERHSITSDTKILGQREMIIGGYPAYEITKHQDNWSGYPNGKIAKSIAVNYQGGFLTIYYHEDFKDRAVIKSSDDWELTSLFNKILSTFQFPWSLDEAAVIKGTEIPEFRTSGSLGCYIYDEYIVKTTPYNNHTGERISTFIRPKRIKETDLCEARLEDKIITIDIDDASWFDGINKNLMFIGFYTGPAGRLEVYDLITKSKLHDIDYHDPITLKEGRYLSYEGFIKWVNSPDECPENEKSAFHEYGTGLAGDFNFDLLAGKETINEKYCRYFQ